MTIRFASDSPFKSKGENKSLTVRGTVSSGCLDRELGLVLMGLRALRPTPLQIGEIILCAHEALGGPQLSVLLPVHKPHPFQLWRERVLGYGETGVDVGQTALHPSESA